MKARSIAALLLLSLVALSCDSGGVTSVQDTAPDAVAIDTQAPEDTQQPSDTPPDTPVGPPWEFSPPGAPLVPVEFAALPANAEGLVFDGDGGLYVSGMDGFVYRIDGAGSVTPYAELLPVEGPAGDVAGMARSPDGALLVCRYGAGRIERILPGEPPTVEIHAEGLDHPNSMAFTPDGVLWYTASGNGAEAPGHVGRIVDGVAEMLLEGIVYANGLAFSPDGGWVWLTSTDPGSLLRAPLGPDGLPGGAVEIVAEGPDLAVADGLAVAPDGTVFVAGFGTARIYAWTDGALITVAEAAAPPGIAGVASLAFGVGEGFSETALYATNLLQPKLFSVELTQ